MSLNFGVTAYDKCPEKTGRYHVIDESGFIRWKSDYGFAAYDHAGNLSDREPNITFSAIDTRDGSLYGAYRNGVDIEDGTPTGSDTLLLEETNPLFGGAN